MIKLGMYCVLILYRLFNPLCIKDFPVSYVLWLGIYSSQDKRPKTLEIPYCYAVYLANYIRFSWVDEESSNHLWNQKMPASESQSVKVVGFPAFSYVELPLDQSNLRLCIIETICKSLRFFWFFLEYCLEIRVTRD